jgi:Domain of unknown function (DUF4267)
MIPMLDNLAMIDYQPSGARLSFLARMEQGDALACARNRVARSSRDYRDRDPISREPEDRDSSFGLPLPEEGANIGWWLRLKGVRDIASGLAVLAFMAWGGPRTVGIILLTQSIIPVGDMLLILAAKGSAKSAFGIHGFTALLMILAAILLTIEAP